MKGWHALKKVLLLITLLAVAALLTAMPPVLSAEADTLRYDYYLLLVIEASNPAAYGWAEPVVLSHNRPNKVIIADSLDCNTIYTVGGKKVRMGDIYAMGGEKLVMSVINTNFGLVINKYAKTTYQGLNAIANILGRPIDVGSMIAASKSSDRGAVRREQLKFIDAVANGMHNISLSKAFSLVSAAFKHVDTNIGIWDTINLARDLIGGTFIPNDGSNLSFQL